MCIICQGRKETQQMLMVAAMLASTNTSLVRLAALYDELGPDRLDDVINWVLEEDMHPDLDNIFSDDLVSQGRRGVCQLANFVDEFIEACVEAGQELSESLGQSLTGVLKTHNASPGRPLPDLSVFEDFFSEEDDHEV